MEGLALGPNNLQGRRDSPKAKRLPQELYQPFELHWRAQARNIVWLRHFDAASCLSLNEEAGLLYSGSWDKTMKVWRISDFKCCESAGTHEDAVNLVVVGFDRLVFIGSADGTVKVWRWEVNGKYGATKHMLLKILLRYESAVATLAASLALRRYFVPPSLKSWLCHYFHHELGFQNKWGKTSNTVMTSNFVAI